MSKPSKTDVTAKPKRRRWMLFKLIVVLALASGAYWYVANPKRAAGLAEGLLEAITGASIRIETARFSLNGTIELHGVAMRVPKVNDVFGKLFEAQHVLIEHNVVTLLFGKFHPTAINFTRPVIYQIQDIRNDTIRTNFQLLRQHNVAMTRPALPTYLPRVQLTDGLVKFCEYDGQGLDVIHTERLEGSGLTDSTNSTRYNFILRLHDRHDEPTAILTGKFNPADQTFTAQIENFTISDAHRHWLPRPWRQWWDDHKPSGTIRRTSFGYDIEQKQFFAQIEIRDAKIIPPYTPFVDASIAMTGGSGKFTFTNNRVEIENLTGQIEGIRYRINGDFRGFDADAPFRLSVQATQFMIPDQPRYLMVMPRPVIELFRRLQPAGKFSARVEMNRQQRGGKLAYEGNVALHDVTLMYDKFPYKLSRMRGEVRFDQDQIELVSLAGVGPTGAKVMIDGKLWPPNGGNEDVYVTATNAPFDEALYEAMLKPGDRAAFDLFFNKDEHHRLIDAGLIQTSAQHEAVSDLLIKLLVEHDKMTDAAAAAQLDGQIADLRRRRQVPVFDLGGRVTLISHVLKKQGVDQQAKVTTEIDVSGVNMVYVHWPYPLHVMEGKLIIEPQKVTIEVGLARGTGDEPAHFAAEGTIVRLENHVVPDLKLVMQNVPIDPTLQASLATTPREWIKMLHITGMLDAQGRVFTNDEGRIDFALEMDLSNGTANPFGQRIKVRPFSGQVTLSRNRIEFKHLQGDHGHSHFALTGRASWEQGANQCSLLVKADQLRFEDPIEDLMPPDSSFGRQIQKLADKYTPQGVYDAILVYHVRDGQLVDTRLQLSPKHITLDLRGQRITLDNLTGILTVRPQLIHIDDLAGTFADSRFLTTGRITLGQDPLYELTVQAQSQQIDDVSRVVLPSVVARAFDSLELACDYELRQTQVTYRPKAVDGPTVVVKGIARLNNASAVIGVPFKQLTGDLYFNTSYHKDDTWPKLDLQLSAQQVRIFDRLVGPLSLTLSNAVHRNMLSVKELRGQCYGGVVGGEGLIELGEHGYYRMTAMLADSKVGPILKPYDKTNGPNTETKQHNLGQGLLSASLAIEGHRGLIDTRQGRGRLIVSDAKLYRGPLALALLQLINLTFPTAGAFNDASAQYLIDGDMVLFDSLVFGAPSVRLDGAGTMRLSTRQLDLQLRTSNPSGWDLGPLSDLIARIKDELISIHVGGTLEKPKARATSFRGTANSVSHIFARPAPKPKTAGALPKDRPAADK